MDACPKCGGTAGYDFTSLERHVYAGEWGVAADNMDVTWAKFPKTVKCADNGCRVPIDVAEGEVGPIEVRFVGRPSATPTEGGE